MSAEWMKQAAETATTVLTECEARLEPGVAGFGHRVFDAGLDTYATRLRALGLADRKTVLDAGSGFGQWSLAWVGLGADVHAIDVAAERLQVLQQITERLSSPYPQARWASLDALPFDAEQFDAAFCYGALFCTPWKESLAELVRVLRPGGRLYVNANELGWYVHQWMGRPNATRAFDPRESAARSLRNTLEYERSGRHEAGAQILIPREALLAALEDHGLTVLAHGGEGTVHLDESAPAPTPFFQATYHGLPGVYEIVAERRS